jgi:hypothetical protein
VSAPEARKPVAHGETVGINVQMEKAPDGAKEISVGDFLPPLLAATKLDEGGPGLDFFGLLSVAAPQLQMDFENTPCIIFNFGRPCESTRPTGWRFAFTPIKSRQPVGVFYKC